MIIVSWLIDLYLRPVSQDKKLGLHDTSWF